ncbi:acyl-CoA dehydrogenase family protein [Streptomyces sp. SPB162]|uniref:acyl-CoA dehydrogenase family protein n=1 Tax=Streptomyces sp. SPB162 TaxID=2940560 RepID=UPI00240626FB|nr:acyl-CoA dehydrogenase family protein [Streptomyces sp. SPB162]
MTALDTARAVQSVLSEHAATTDTTAAFPVAGVAALRESGLFGLLIPRQYGGLGGDVADLVEVAQVLAAGCLSTAMIWAMHCQQVDALVRHAGSRLREELLPKIARGEVYIASVTTDSGKGGHLLTVTASLQQSGQTVTIERDAPIVTGGEHADGFLMTMRATADAPDSKVSLVYVPRDQLRVETRGNWDPLGMRGTRSVGMKLTGEVPADHIVGEPGGFRAVATDSMIATGHLGWAACWLGAARSAMCDLVGLIRSPKRPQSLNSRSDLTAERLARARMDLELVSAYLHRVTAEIVSHREAGISVDNPTTQIHLNTLKVTAAEMTFQAVDRLVQLAGLSTGYLKSSTIPLERHFRDLRSASLNYSNDRLLTATGTLTLLDRAVRLA